MDGTEVIAGRPATQVLAEGRQAVEPVLHSAVRRLPSSMQRIVSYHFGWCDEEGNPIETPAGKAIRPTLVQLAAQAVGRCDRQTLAAACAVELVHNFSLLHDDVMDGDLTRRHRPTAWSVFGTGAAILAGDSLLTLALDQLAGSGHPASAEATSMLSAAVQDLVEGQSADMSFERRSGIDLTECLGMASNKTGALFGCACALGAVYGGGNRHQVAALAAFGRQLGLAFQCVDDLLGIWGDPASTGKPVYSDVDNRKKSLPVVAALTSGTRAGRELATLYATDRQLGTDELAEAAALIEAAGGRQWCQQRADSLYSEALRYLDEANPRPHAAAELTTLARLMVARDH